MKVTDEMKAHLTSKLLRYEKRIKKKQLKYKIIKILGISSTISSVVITVASAATLPILTPILSSILISSAAFLTGMGGVFNFNRKTKKLHVLIQELEKVRKTLEYVITCNGNLTEEEYLKMLKEY